MGWRQQYTSLDLLDLIRRRKGAMMLRCYDAMIQAAIPSSHAHFSAQVEYVRHFDFHRRNDGQLGNS